MHEHPPKEFGAEGGTRTPTWCKPDWILSPARLPVPPLRRLTMQLDSGQRRNHAHDECVAGTALQILFTLPRFYSRRTTFVIDQFERSSITRRRYTSTVMLPHSRREILRHPDVQLQVLQRAQDVYDEHRETERSTFPTWGKPDPVKRDKLSFESSLPRRSRGASTSSATSAID